MYTASPQIYIVSIIIIMVDIHMQCSKATKCGDVESVQGMTLAPPQLCEMALVSCRLSSRQQAFTFSHE